MEFNDYNDINGELDLKTLLEGTTASILTPQLAKITEVSNTKKPKVIADILIREMHKQLNKNVTKNILHNGAIHKISYFDVEPLTRGNWSIISLMLLNISYNEQCIIIESIYPVDLQLPAKAFALNFTNNTEQTVYIENDKELVDKLDSANVGIALLLAMINSLGGSVNHIDSVKNQMKNLEKIQKDMKEVKSFKLGHESSQQASKFRDRLGR